MRLPIALLALAVLPALAESPPQAARVAARPFAEIAVHPQREAPAAAVSLNESRISAEVSAVVKEIAYDVGQVAPKGAVLIRLETRDHELAVARAEAVLEGSRARARLAEQQLARSRALATQGFHSAEALAQKETELAVQQAQVRLDEAQLAQARRNLEKCTLRAPFTAIVRSRQAQVGEIAAPGTPLLTLAEATRVEVAAQVPPAEVASPAISREARLVDVRLAFVGKPAAPGADGRIVWRDPQPHLPAELVSKRGSVFGVFVLENGKARFAPLPDAQEGRPVAAPELAGRLVITDGRHGLADGQAVQVRR